MSPPEPVRHCVSEVGPTTNQPRQYVREKPGGSHGVREGRAAVECADLPVSGLLLFICAPCSTYAMAVRSEGGRTSWKALFWLAQASGAALATGSAAGAGELPWRPIPMEDITPSTAWCAMALPVPIAMPWAT